MTDYTEDDRWDWDRSDESQYCKHGTFIGSWWGPDLLCQWCEDGTSDAEFQAYCEEHRWDTYRKNRRDELLRDGWLLNTFVSIMKTFVNRPNLREWATGVLSDEMDDAIFQEYTHQLKEN